MTKLLDGLPSHLRVGPHKIAIAVKNKLNEDDDLGLYRHGVSIELRADQHNAMGALETVLHEVGHGVWATFGLDADSTEEHVVNAFSTGLVMILRDNPELLKWIAATLKK